MNDHLPLETTNQLYDVFLSHNSQDKPAVETLAVRLTDEAGIEVWFDKWNLKHSEPFLEQLEKGINQSRACTVFIGPGGLSPWHNEEMRVALQRRVEHPGFRVVLALLPNAAMPERGLLPSFLSRLPWVDFRTDKGLLDDEKFHELVCGIKGEEPGRRQTISVATIECPYRGLEVFDEEHARFFFGREAMTQHLVEALRPTRFLCVLGPSGSGKSSLARAGLLPQLRAGKLPGSQRWQFVVFKPGAHPIEELALNLVELQKGQHQISDATQLIKNFNDDETALHIFARLLLKAQTADVRLFLLLDQFEEILDPRVKAAERVQFIKILRHAGTIDGGRTVIVPTMRADFLARAAESPDLAELLSTHQFIVSPMEADELRRAIEEPARLAGLRFEPGLAERILNDVGNEPGALPLLEHALRELFEKRSSENVITAQSYEQSGGVQGALAQKAEAIYAQFTLEQQTILRRVMLRLTQPGEGTSDTRRRAGQHEFWQNAEERAAVEKVLYMLANERLLTTSRDASGKEQVDVAHEALIRSWPRLNNWINDNREGLRLQHRLSEDAKEWQKRDKDESFLYPGARLAEWEQNNSTELNELERAFLAASAKRETRLEEEELKRKRVQLKRTRIFAAVVSMAFIIAAVFGLLAFYQQRKAKESGKLSRQSLYALRMSTAWRAHEEKNYPRVYDLLNSSLPDPSQSDDVRSFDWYHLWQLSHNEKATLKGHESFVFTVAFAPDGKTLASGSKDRTIRLWNVDSQRNIATLKGHEADIFSVVFSPDGKMLASASGDKTVKLWDVGSHRNIATFKGRDLAISSVAFSPDSHMLASACLDYTVKLWDLVSGKSFAILRGHKAAVHSVTFSPHGRTLASGSFDSTVKLWDRASGQNLVTFRGHKAVVSSVTFSPDGRTLASASSDHTIKLWDCESGENLATFEGHEAAVSSVTFSPDGKTLASASEDYTIKLWDRASGQNLATFRGHENLVSSVAFSPDGRSLASASVDNTIKLWDEAPRQNFVTLKGHEAPIYSVAFSPDGRTLASASDDHTVRLWDRMSGENLATLKGHGDFVLSVAFSPDGRTLASASNDHTVKLWDRASGKNITTFSGHENSVCSVAFSPDGRTLASASEDKTIKLWDVGSHRNIVTFKGHTDGVRSIAYSLDGRTLASASYDFTVKLWGCVSGQNLVTFSGHEGRVWSVAFSPDRRTLASASYDHTVKLWDRESGHTLATLKGHEATVFSVAFSPDGRTLASAGMDRTIKLWDWASRESLATLKGHEAPVLSVAFSPDGKTLASAEGSEPGRKEFSIRLWFAATDDEVARQRNK